MTEFEITMSPSTGVQVSFKVEQGASKKAVEAATTEAATHLKVAFDGWEAWADKNATPQERKFKKMGEEQRELQLKQWEEHKRSVKSAQDRLRSI